MLKCLYPGCNPKKEIKRLIRGLCFYHYTQASRFVGAGITTWDKLVSEGKCNALLRKREHKNQFKNWILTTPTNKQDSNVQ